MLYYGHDLTDDEREVIKKLKWDKDPEYIDGDYLERLVNAIRQEVVDQVGR